jgi:FkbM family methyltransferase
MLRRLYGLLTSELVWRSRLRYLSAALLGRWGVTGGPGGRPTFCLKDGTRIQLRQGSTDFRVFEEIFIERVYSRFAGRLPKDRTIVDLGANIGLSAIFLAQAAPRSRVIALEPDAGNFAMLLENLAGAGLEHRVAAIQAFAGAEPGFAGIEDSGNGEWGLRMGARSHTGVPVVTISELVDGAGPVSVKCDIEGTERELFSRLREWEHLVGFILLELHTELFPPNELYRILQGSGYEWVVHGEIPVDACIALIALERKAR